MSNQQWRLLFGAIGALCAFLLVQPIVQEQPLALLVIGGVNVVVAFIRAPETDPGE